MGLLGILVALALLMWLAYRGWSVLLLAPAAALVAAAISREPLLAHWTQTFMGSAARFIAQWFPLFLLGALFGKLMDDSGSVTSIARYMTERLGTRRAMLAVVLSSAVVTYGGVSVFVAFFVLVPMAQALFQAADIPRRLMAAAIALGTLTFTMTALPGTPALQNAIPMPFFDTTPFAAPGLGIIASVIILAFGLWWLGRAEAAARRAGEGYGGAPDVTPADHEEIREHATAAREFDPAEIRHGKRADSEPPFILAVLPLVVVIVMNFLMSLVVLPRFDFSFLAQEAWGGTTIGHVAGIWSVAVALAAATLTAVIINYQRLPALRESMDRLRQAHASRRIPRHLARWQRRHQPEIHRSQRPGRRRPASPRRFRRDDHHRPGQSNPCPLRRNPRSRPLNARREIAAPRRRRPHSRRRRNPGRGRSRSSRAAGARKEVAVR